MNVDTRPELAGDDDDALEREYAKGEVGWRKQASECVRQLPGHSGQWLMGLALVVSPPVCFPLLRLTYLFQIRMQILALYNSS
jgi:hypothetical protein